MRKCDVFFVNVYYVFIYLILFIGRVVVGLIPLTNIGHELEKAKLNYKSNKKNLTNSFIA